MSPPTSPVLKPGMATTEGWGGLVAPLAGAAAVIREFPDKETRCVTIIAAALVLITYIVARTLLKLRHIE